MAKGHKPGSLAALAAELQDTPVQDVDPEAFGAAVDAQHGSENSESESDEDNSRAHYEQVGKSKLRKLAAPTLGPQYVASKISRKDLIDDFGGEFGGSSDDDDDAFAKRDDLEDLDSRHGSSEDESVADEDEFDDPDDLDTVDLAAQMEIDDEEIDSDEAFGDGDDELFKKKGFNFQGNKMLDSQAVDGDIDGDGSEDEFSGFDEDREIEIDQADDFGSAAYEGSESELDGADGAETEESSSDEDLGSSDQFSDSMASDEDSNTDGTSPEEQEDASIDRVALREMMAAEQRQIVATISEATKADAAKGQAVKQQYSAFDILVGTRIHLQKALVAANSLSAEHLESPDPSDASSELSAAAEAAESAALKLLNSITSLQQDLSDRQASNKAHSSPLKRPFSATVSTPSPSIHAALTNLSSSSTPSHRSSLLKWSTKIAPISTLAPRNKLSAAPAPQPLTSVLDSYLQDPSLTRLIQRTQTPRSCAPIQAATAAATTTTTTSSSTPPSQPLENPSIFDDADFYALLLRELIEHKKAYASAAPNSNHATNGASSLLDPAIEAASSLRATKTHRKNVDRQASKGRKMRFNVHEKLLNFVAPREMPGSGWEREKREEFFRGLLGKRVEGGEERGDGGGMEEEEDEEVRMEGLRLFTGV